MWIAARGFQHPAWLGSFYPADLPAEWMLTYYANGIPAVLLPEPFWLPAGPDVAAVWLADTVERFRFFLEVEGALEEALRLAERLGGRCGGLVAAPGQAPAGAGPWVVAVRRCAGRPSARVLRSELEALPRDGLLVIEGDPPDPGTLRDAVTLAELLG